MLCASSCGRVLAPFWKIYARSSAPFVHSVQPIYTSDARKKNCSCRRRSHRHQSRQSTPIAQLRRAQLVFIDILLHYLFIYLWFSHVRTNVRTTSMTLESLKHFATVDKETSSLPSSHFHRRRASVCVCVSDVLIVTYSGLEFPDFLILFAVDTVEDAVAYTRFQNFAQTKTRANRINEELIQYVWAPLWNHVRHVWVSVNA